MKPIHGKIMMITGLAHSAIALTIYKDRWSQFFEKWLFRVSPHSVSADRKIIFSDVGSEAAIWFFIGGVLFFVLGQLMHSIELKNGKLPNFFGWELLAIGVLFAWMAPESGFTLLVIPQAVYAVIRSRRFE